ncbi:MAG: hypothetical protein LBQ39_09805 [Tannerellaceae bacterium]|jgi:hypothetical protein|nr:hypothetical protein [Tannerellaceae bacterium]
MAFFSFYNVRKPRQFEHKPIYWDPRKEDLEERTHRIKRELGLEKPDETYKPSIKGTFVEGTTHLKKNRMRGYDTRSRQYKNVKLIVIIAVLVVLFWALFLK